MMKYQLSAVCCFLMMTASAQEKSEFVAKLKQLKEADSPAELEKFLIDSEKTETENPDFYAQAGNYWWGVSQKISISQKPPEKGDFAVEGIGKGAAKGSISTVGKVNPAVPEKALNLIKTGYGKFPNRLDLGFGLAALQRKLGKSADLEVTLLAILEAAKQPDDLRWAEDGELPNKAAEFVPASVHSYVRYFFDQETDEDDARCDRVTQRVTEVFPKHPYAWNMRSALADVKGESEGVIFNLTKAHEIAPEDPIVLLNLADTFIKQKQPAKAKEAAEKVLKIESAKARHADAEKILKALEASE